MTTLWESDDATDVRRALKATGVLAAFNVAGVLEAADVHVARRLCELTGEHDEEVALAVALTVRAVRHGSVCLELARAAEIGEGTDLAWPEPAAWQDAVAASPLVAAGLLRLEDGLVHLDRYHRQEVQVARDLGARAARPAPPVDTAVLDAALDRLYPDARYAEQRAAVAGAAGRWTTVLTGGPGTGKTTTVARLLAVLAEQHEAQAGHGHGPVRIALAAPTGKAAARMVEQVRAAAAVLPPQDAARLEGLQAQTLHRLLGWRPDSQTRFRHDRSNRLPHDVVVVDEASMVSLTHTARLLEAVRPDARLVLVGDPDQLASVEAGAVLDDLVRGYRGRDDSPVAALSTVHRFGEHIGALATALRDGDADAALAVLEAGHPDVLWVPTTTGAEVTAAVREAALPHARELHAAAVAGDVPAALAALDRHRLLCAHRDQVRFLNGRVEEWLREVTGDPLRSRMYAGRPVLVTANDHGLGVYNGDTGVVVAGPSGTLRAVIAGAGGPLDLAPGRLGDVETVHAMTIHKAQGSQAAEVTVVLPEVGSRLLTRELLYTAVTRASGVIRVIGPEESLRAAVARRAQRASGLQRRIADADTL